ncbi:MAG: glycosyltransferase family 2 protein [Pseudomonadota bacterium]
MRLSLCMIVRDEAFFIEECLEQVRPYVDEIVIVDTGSVDGTREIAERYADCVLDFEWIDDFSAARNFGLDAATGDWLLVLDADERIAAGDYMAMREAMANDSFDGYYLEQRDYSNESLLRGRVSINPEEAYARGYTGYTTNKIMRLFRRSNAIRFQSPIHEIVDGTVSESRRAELHVPIHHYCYENPVRPRLDRAIRYMGMMEAELAKGDDARLLYIAGTTALYATKDYKKAEHYLRKSAKLGYQPEYSLEGAAEAAYRGGDLEIATNTYSQLYEGGYRSTGLCLNLANLSVKTGNRLKAIRLLEECLALGGLGPEVNKVIENNIAALSS